MAQDKTIKFGNSNVEFTKSDRLIAIVPNSGEKENLEAQVASEVGREALANGYLGPFLLVDVTSSVSDVDEALDIKKADPKVAGASNVYHTGEDKVPFVPTGTVYVKFKPDVSDEECEKLLSGLSLEIAEARGAKTLLVRTSAASPDPLAVASALQASGITDVAEPDFYTEGSTSSFEPPTDELMARQWHLENVGRHYGTSIGFKAGADARVVQAWKLAGTLGDPSIVVAVIDDGFDLEHPDLADPDKTISAWDFKRGNSDPIPDRDRREWHGTACAGIAVGSANGSGILGAAPNCKLMPIRWGPSLSDEEVERWFAWVTDKGADVVSCSWSAKARKYPLSTRKLDAISRCAREGRGGLGCVVVFAADNSNRNINAPDSNSINGFAIHPDVIAVAASNSKDERADYSSFGQEICVCAPSSGAGGWKITTSDVLGTYQVNGNSNEAGYSIGGYTDDFGGTSSACPLVAGICALILSIEPNLRSEEVKMIIGSTARKIGNLKGYEQSSHSIYFGYGCIDAASAIKAAIHRAEQRAKRNHVSSLRDDAISEHQTA